MITLITASPGGGKTAAVVKMMMDAHQQGRPIIQMGIPDLQIPYEPVPPVEDWTEQRQSPEDPSLSLDYFKFPQNALVVLDECQRVYRVRGAASKVPPHVSALETHRHTGIDMILITQHPALIDVNVRKLVGRHIHLRDIGFLGRYWYEWEQCVAEPSTAWKTAPIRKRYKLPQEVFPLYKSASLHVKPVRTFPPALKLVAVGVPVIVGLSWWISHRIDPARSQSQPPSLADKSAASSPSEVHSGREAGAGSITDFLPSHPMHPEFAPAYGELRVVKSMPMIVGCVAVKNVGCSCYTQQMTRIDAPRDQCEAWIKSPPFNPWLEAKATEKPREELRREPDAAAGGGSRAQNPEPVSHLGESPQAYKRSVLQSLPSGPSPESSEASSM